MKLGECSSDVIYHTIFNQIKYFTAHFFIVLILFSCGSDDNNSTAPAGIGVAGDGTLNAVLETIRTKYNVPALGALLIEGNEIIETGAAGLRAIGYSEQVTVNDHWHMGSITKAMTSTVVARLIERGELSWTTTITSVFPDLIGNIRSEYEDVRLEELLSHTSGLPGDITQAISWSTYLTSELSIKEQRKQLARDLLNIEPEVQRGTHLYANGGYVIAGAMLEEITGKTWEELMQEELYAPLGMTESGFGAPGTADRHDEPWGHVPQSDGWTPVEPGIYADNPAVIGPAGTVSTTFNDFAKYMMAHLAGARGESGIVSAAAFTKLHTAVGNTGYAMGWGVAERDWAGGRVLQHSGSNTFWYANLWIAPNKNFAMLAVCNAAGDKGFPATDEVVATLLQRFDMKTGN